MSGMFEVTATSTLRCAAWCVFLAAAAGILRGSRSELSFDCHRQGWRKPPRALAVELAVFHAGN